MIRNQLRTIAAAALAFGSAAASAAPGAPAQHPAARVVASAPGIAPRVPAGVASADSFPEIAILCYHDLTTESGARLENVTPEFLRAQIRSSKRDGWTIVPLSRVIAAREHPERLPRRTLVLTFDDGYRSFHDLALPILEAEGVAATVALVTSFQDHPPADLPRMMSWDQVRAAVASERVEVASHTDDLHRYETSNPYRDTGPSVTTRRYRLAEARYETREEFHERIRAGIDRSQEVLERELGRRAEVMVWPYGEHNEMARALAQSAGMPVSLTLAGRAVSREDLATGCLPRVLVTREVRFDDAAIAWLRESRRAIRAAQVDLDALWDPNDAVFRHRIDRVIDDLRRTGATHVFLQACPDLQGDGRIAQTWFMNHQVPVRADVWSMVAAKLAQARMKVWVRAPSMNLSWVWERHPEWRIPSWPTGRAGEKAPWYFRLSPNLPEARRAAVDFYTDLAVYLPIAGVLFDDDAYLLPEESLNGDTLTTTAAKAAAIDGLLADIKRGVRAWRPGCQFARNLYAPVVERSGIHPAFAQDFEQSLREDDLSVVMAYARMEGHRRDAERWTETLARTAARRAARVAVAFPRARPLLKVQAYDWRKESWVPADEIVGCLRAVRRGGVNDLGLYPLLPDQPNLAARLFEAALGPEFSASDSSQR